MKTVGVKVEEIKSTPLKAMQNVENGLKTLNP